MIRTEIITMFRDENPDVTSRVAGDSVLHSWLKEGNKEVCMLTKCIYGDESFTAVVDQASYDLPTYIDNFFDIDDCPGGGVLFNDDPLKKTTIAELDQLTPSWRSYSSGTPLKWYRRGNTLGFDRAPDTAYTVQVYTYLLPNDFDNDDEEPFNELEYLRPFHYSLVLYLQKRAKMKKGKTGEEAKALQEYTNYVAWMKREVRSIRYGKVYLRRKDTA